MKHKKKAEDDVTMFSLDRNGGQDKIAKATYSPKAYRRENAASGRPSAIKTFVTWCAVLCLIFGFAYLLERHQGKSFTLQLPTWARNI